jgi:anti-sigma B factor antagonist
MHIRERQSGGLHILRIDGDLLSEEAHEHLCEWVRTLVAGGTTQLTIDLSGIRYINSCGLGSLVSAFTTARKAGGEVRLAGSSLHVRELLAITHLDRVFTLLPGTEPADRRSGGGTC